MPGTEKLTARQDCKHMSGYSGLGLVYRTSPLKHCGFDAIAGQYIKRQYYYCDTINTDDHCKLFERKL